jgi:hypothetical protein
MKRIPDEVSGSAGPTIENWVRSFWGTTSESPVLVVGRRTRTATPCRSSVTRTAWWLTMCSISVTSGHPG